MRVLFVSLCILHLTFLAVIPLSSQEADTGRLQLWEATAREAQRDYRFSESTRIFRLVIAGYKALGDACRLYSLNNQIAYNFLDQERGAEAIWHIDSLVDAFGKNRDCPDTTTWVGLLLTQHIIYRDLNQVKRSKVPLDRALDLALQIGDTISLAKIYNNYTAYFGDQGANYLAMDYAERSMRLKKIAMDKKDPSYIRGLYTLANYAERVGNYESSYAYLDSIIQLAGAEGTPELADTYHLLALICIRKNDFAVARKYAELALQIFITQSGEDGRSTSYGYHELGLAQAGLQEYTEALESFRRAYAIRRKKFGPDHRLTLSSLSQLIKTRIRLGDPSGSIEDYKKIVENFIRQYRIGDAPKYALNLLEIGKLYQESGQPDSAMVYYQKVWEIANEFYPRGDRVCSEANLALAGIGPVKERSRYVQQALFHLTGDSALSSIDRSTFAFATDKFAVLKVFHLHAENLYTLYLREQNDIYLEQLLNLVPQFDLIKNEIFNQFLASKSIIESAPIIREISLLRLRASNILFKKTNNSRYLSHALQAMEESKNILLQTQLFEKNLKNLLQLPDSLIRSERELYQEINELEVELKRQPSDSLSQIKLDLERKYFDIRRNILRQSNKLNELTNDKSIDLEIIRDQLGASTLAIDYFLDQQELYILAIGKNFIWLNSYPFNESDQSRMAELIERLRSLPKSSNDEDFIDLAHQFHQKLIPFAIPANIKRLIILPDNDLHMVPFDILLPEEPQSGSGISGLSFLIKKFEIIYLTGFKIIASQKIKNNSGAVAFAPFIEQILGQNHSLPVLKYSDEEIKSIGDYFDLQVYRGQEATQENFKNLAGPLKILHIASHAVINNRYPLQSNILFYPARENDDGRLQLYEIYGMSLPSNLAVLAACETGDGAPVNGGAAMNISRGFSFAGTHQVISNLWPAQDYASSRIMEKFYQSLQQNFDPGKALQEAKLSYLAETEGPLLHPVYWAGWTCQYSQLQPEADWIRRYSWALWLSMIPVLYLAWKSLFRKKSEKK